MKQKELNKILVAHKLWLDSDGKDGEKANLRGADLTGANLSGVDLTGANLENAILDKSKEK